MKFVSPRRSIAARKLLMPAFALVTVLPAVAQTQQDQKLAPVTVSASRFSSETAPIGATIITAEQMREAGVGSVNEAIRKIGGVFGRMNFSGTSDFSLDLRGFSANANQNVVIFVDGIRISENEQAPAMMSSIPIESVERIEIVRGGSSVLYGDGATGGTIQIITKRGLKNAMNGSVVTEIGNRGQKELRASLIKSWNSFSMDANLGTLRTDNYRDNNELKQENFSGGIQWSSMGVRVGFRVDAARQNFRFPGSLTLSQYQQDPQQTLTPSDKGALDSNRYTLFAEKRTGNWTLATDFSYREKTSKGTFVDPFGVFESTAKSNTTQFSPRIKHESDFGNFKNEVVFGMDFAHSKRFTESSYSGFFSPDQDTSQDSTAIYAQDQIKFGKMRIMAGARHEQFDQNLIGVYDQSFSVNAWNLQGNYDLTSVVSLFAKAGRSYRVANVDDNAYLTEPLNPQFSNDLEIGGAFGNDDRKLIVKVFRHRLKNEIFLDPTPAAGLPYGKNINLDRTERDGVEIETRIRLASTFSVSGVLQHLSAKFTDGPNDGNEITLVPKNIATIRLNWLPGNGQTADVGMQWVDKQRYGKDFSNSCNARIPAFATLDARYAVRIGAWEFGVIGNNLTDKNYYAQAFGDCSNDRGIYPDAGRSVRLSARMDF